MQNSDICRREFFKKEEKRLCTLIYNLQNPPEDEPNQCINKKKPKCKHIKVPIHDILEENDEINVFFPCTKFFRYATYLRMVDEMVVKPICNEIFANKIEKLEDVLDINSIIVTGGINTQNLFTMRKNGTLCLRYNLKTHQWDMGQTVPQPRYYHACTLMNEAIYVIGGINLQRKIMPCCFRYSISEDKWSSIKSLIYPRAYHCSVSYDGVIYTIGGKTKNKNMLKSIETYSNETGEWEEIGTTLCCPRVGMGATAFDGNIWIVGGIVKPDNQDRTFAVGDIQKLSLDKMEWEYFDVAGISRCFAGVTNYQNEIYIIGGIGRFRPETDFASLKIVEKFEVHRPRFKRIPALQNPRHALTVVALEDRMFAIGGFSTRVMSSVCDVEAIDLQTCRRWQSFPPLPTCLTGCSATFLKDIVKRPSIFDCKNKDEEEPRSVLEQLYMTPKNCKRMECAFLPKDCFIK